MFGLLKETFRQPKRLPVSFSSGALPSVYIWNAPIHVLGRLLRMNRWFLLFHPRFVPLFVDELQYPSSDKIFSLSSQYHEEDR